MNNYEQLLNLFLYKLFWHICDKSGTKLLTMNKTLSNQVVWVNMWWPNFIISQMPFQSHKVRVSFVAMEQCLWWRDIWNNLYIKWQRKLNPSTNQMPCINCNECFTYKILKWLFFRRDAIAWVTGHFPVKQ